MKGTYEMNIKGRTEMFSIGNEDILDQAYVIH